MIESCWTLAMQLHLAKSGSQCLYIRLSLVKRLILDFSPSHRPVSALFSNANKQLHDWSCSHSATDHEQHSFGHPSPCGWDCSRKPLNRFSFRLSLDKIQLRLSRRFFKLHCPRRNWSNSHSKYCGLFWVHGCCNGEVSDTKRTDLRNTATTRIYRVVWHWPWTAYKISNQILGQGPAHHLHSFEQDSDSDSNSKHPAQNLPIKNTANFHRVAIDTFNLWVNAFSSKTYTLLPHKNWHPPR